MKAAGKKEQPLLPLLGHKRGGRGGGGLGSQLGAGEDTHPGRWPQGVLAACCIRLAAPAASQQVRTAEAVILILLYNIDFSHCTSPSSVVCLLFFLLRLVFFFKLETQILQR